MNKSYGFIYRTTLPDGRYYIGQHKIINHSTLDETYFGSGRVIRDYITSRGKEKLVREILEFYNSHDEGNLVESKYITEETLNDPLCINLDLGGRSVFSRYKEVNSRIGETVSKLRQENPERWTSLKGADNNLAKEWKLISPEGEEFFIKGTLNEFCESKGISANTIKTAVRQGWIPKRGKCAGWKAFDLTTGNSTYRDTLNHGESHSGNNNPWYKNKKEFE